MRFNPWLDLAHAGLGVGWVYLLTFADRRFGWWDSVGLDFSTHTGVALVLALALGRRARRLRPLLALLMIGYAAWMITLRHHSALDIITSAAVVAPVALLIPRRQTTPD